MKKILLIAILFATALTAGAQSTFTAFLSDDDVMTSIRNSPKGAAVIWLSSEDFYVFDLATPRNGWWRVVSFWNAENYDEDTSLEGSNTGEYWIHYSVLAVDTRNYGGQTIYLRAAPDEDAAVVAQYDEEMRFRPVDIQGDWVKVKLDNTDIVGWIEAEWLCSNPLTNCC